MGFFKTIPKDIEEQAMIDGFADGWRRQLQASDFRAGCPVVAVAVEADAAAGARPYIERHVLAFNGARGWAFDTFFHAWNGEFEAELLTLLHPVTNHSVGPQPLRGALNVFFFPIVYVAKLIATRRNPFSKERGITIV
jgi:hypothetical protein